MANDKPVTDKQYTLNDLSNAMRDLSTAQGDQAEWIKKAEASERAAKSHREEANKTEAALERARAAIRKILSNLEKV
jgi:hypothetical protein